MRFAYSSVMQLPSSQNNWFISFSKLNMSEIFSLPPSFHRDLSRFKLLSLYTKSFSQISHVDVIIIHWLLQWPHQFCKVFWCKAQIWELERWFINLNPTFGFLHLMVLMSFSGCQYAGLILKKYCVSKI